MVGVGWHPPTALDASATGVLGGLYRVLAAPMKTARIGDPGARSAVSGTSWWENAAPKMPLEAV